MRHGSPIRERRPDLVLNNKKKRTYQLINYMHIYIYIYIYIYKVHAKSSEPHQ